jgi:hypothetical protein
MIVLTPLKKWALIILALYAFLLILARVPMMQTLPYFSELTLLVGLSALPCFLFLMTALFTAKKNPESDSSKEKTGTDE